MKLLEDISYHIQKIRKGIKYKRLIKENTEMYKYWHSKIHGIPVNELEYNMLVSECVNIRTGSKTSIEIKINHKRYCFDGLVSKMAHGPKEYFGHTYIIYVAVVGIKDEKTIADCSFEEFLEIYHPLTHCVKNNFSRN